MERNLALAETTKATLEKKLSESAKKEIDQRISFESVTAQINEARSKVYQLLIL